MTIQELEKASAVFQFYDVKNQLREFVYGRADALFAQGDSCRDLIRNIDEVEKRKSEVRRWILEAVGGLPSSETPLNATVTGIIHCDGFRIEKVVFESRPEAYVSANLYIPDNMDTPCGAVLFLLGHAEEAKSYFPYQRVCQYLVQAGLIVLAQDPLGQGERFSYYEDGIHCPAIEPACPEHDYAGNQCWPLGDGIARYFVHDAMRGIDYLCSRPEVDPSRIGVTGSSGGGTQTSLMMMCDPRIAAAAPGTFIMNLKTYMRTGIAQDAEQIWPGMAAYGYDHEDVLLCMAPRPVLVLSASYDFFPVEGTRRSVARVKRFWEMYDRGEDIEMFEEVSDHQYTPRMAQAAADFFAAHLLGKKKKNSCEDEKVRLLPPFDLRCTKSGQIRAEFKGSRFVHAENYSRLEQIRNERNILPDFSRKEEALNWLHERVYSFRKPCEFNPRIHFSDTLYELAVESCLWWSQEGLFNHAYLFKDRNYAGGNISVIIAVWDGGTDQIQQHIAWIREKCCSGKFVVVLNVSGVGAISPNPINGNPIVGFESTLSKFAHDLIWMDDSLAAMRVYDVLRAISMVESLLKVKRQAVSLYAYGRQGFYAQLAAALDSDIKIETDSVMSSIEEWVSACYYDEYDVMSVVLPGMLRHFDLPDIDRWFG